MRQVPARILSGATNGSVNGSQVDSNQLIAASFHIIFTGNDEAGTFKIQASNDIPTNNANVFVVTNWVDIPNATASVASASPKLITINPMSYRWIRAVYTRSSGGASDKTVIVNMFAQSV